MNSVVASAAVGDLLAQRPLLLGREPLTAVELGLGGLAFLNDLAEAHLIGLGEQRKAARLIEVEAQEIGGMRQSLIHCKVK